MVARLVEQHHVGAHQEDAGQRDAHLPAARQRADIPVHHLLAEPQPRQNLARPALEGIAVELLEAALHLAIALDDALDRVRLARIRHGGLEGFQFGRDRADRTGAVHHRGDGAEARHLADVLVEIADGDAAIDGHPAFVGLVLPRDHAEQGRLSGAIGSDEADLLAALQRGGSLDE